MISITTKKKKKWVVVGVVIFSVLLLTAAGIFIYKSLTKEKTDKDKEYLDDCMAKINEIIPFEIKDDIVFITAVEGYDDITVSITSSNPNAVNEDGIVTRLYTHDVSVSLYITLKSPQKEFTYEKRIKILKYSTAETQEFICDMFEQYIPNDLSDGDILPTYIEEYDLTISYGEYAIRNNENIEEIHIDEEGKVTMVGYGSIVKCYIKANFTMNGQQFSFNYAVYTSE